MARRKKQSEPDAPDAVDADALAEDDTVAFEPPVIDDADAVTEDPATPPEPEPAPAPAATGYAAVKLESYRRKLSAARDNGDVGLAAHLTKRIADLEARNG